MKRTKITAELTISTLILAAGLLAVGTICCNATVSVKNALLLFLLAASAVLLHALIRLANARFAK